MLTIIVVSDATGETAERMVRSALVQFENAQTMIVRHGETRTPEQVRVVVQEAAYHDAIILHTLVSDELRDLMLAETRLRGVDSLDLMGPVLERLAHHLRLAPQEKPGLYRQLVEAKSREIEAVDFAFRHDDGQRVNELDRAEIVLVGVSRAMKTPTMLYLAYRGWFAANVPLILEVQPPAKLFTLPRERVFCLDIEPERLLELRLARATASHLPIEPYATSEYIEQELSYAHQLSREHRWRIIDVTGKSVEEVAREIIILLAGKDPVHRRDANLDS